ncbi:uncharacterized protein DUF1707 [Kribbella rubisoli]|uniref:Uncharacterized protein DUF1707 n=1 Tax=Kribbella rubisoli TaxID=3075929 RepID=A0A4Q7X7W7_9ACTN|nr:DUF1707 domain-containing protein [Kribbella rubisoli]RZU19144.1 uncharacterized protein DUF1707 [Kribbella rubisoli]
MTSPDRGRPQRGGPGARGARRGREWQGWNGDWGQQGWDGRSSGGQWRGPGWVGEWRETSWDDPRDGGWNRSDDGGRGRDQDEGRRGDVPRKRVRIGDAERDQAVSLLSDHFVAGRLTQAEFEERSEQATKSRYGDELEPLFDDLPTSMELQVAQRSPAGVRRRPAGVRRRPGPPPPILMLMPFLMIGLVISSLALAAPWLLWGVFWVVLISGMSKRRWHNNYRR